MNRMQLSNERSGFIPSNQEGAPSGSFERGADDRRSTSGFWVNRLYHISKDWLLRWLISDVSKEEGWKTEDASTRLPRIDSGIGFGVYAGDVRLPSDPTNPVVAAAALPLPPPPQGAPISLTFRPADSKHIKTLDYHIYSKWSNTNALLDELSHDSIIVHELWDVNEDMPISSGDWDARIHPGSVIEAWCCNDERVYHSGDGDDTSNSGDDTDRNEDETEGDGDMSWSSSVTDARNEHPWWFARWRERVEREGVKREGVIEKPSWFMMVIWCTSMVAGIVIFSLVC